MGSDLRSTAVGSKPLVDWAAIGPIVLLFALFAAAALYRVGPKRNQEFRGVAVCTNLRGCQFYPDATGCPRIDDAHWLIMSPGDALLPQPTWSGTSDSEILERLMNSSSATRVKLIGDATRIGNYGKDGEDWRELIVKRVITSKLLACEPKR